MIRDSTSNADEEGENVGWLKSEQRLTLDSFEQALVAVKAGIGFCRLSQHMIEMNNDNKITRLNLEYPKSYQIPTHLTLPKGDETGPAAKRLYKTLLESADSRLSKQPIN